MSKTIRVLFTLALGLIAVLAVPMSAQAGPGEPSPVSATAQGDDVHLMLGCNVVSKVNGLNVRRTPGGSDIIGQMQAGNTADAKCDGQYGPSYSNCGGGSYWVPIIWRGASGWVAHSCVNWYVD